MAAFSQDDIVRCIFVNKKFCIVVSTGSDNGLAPKRRQAIIWTNADLIHWRIYAALVWDELNFVC